MASNGTTLDPAFGILGNNEPGPQADAGWFNVNPNNLQGSAVSLTSIGAEQEFYL